MLQRFRIPRPDLRSRQRRLRRLAHLKDTRSDTKAAAELLRKLLRDVLTSGEM
jgi:hypothetical protein